MGKNGHFYLMMTAWPSCQLMALMLVCYFFVTHTPVSSASPILTGAYGQIGVKYPQLVVGRLPFSIKLSFPPLSTDDNKWDGQYYYSVWAHYGDGQTPVTLKTGVLDTPWHKGNIFMDIDTFRGDPLSSNYENIYSVLIDGVQVGKKFSYGYFKLGIVLGSSPLTMDDGVPPKHDSDQFFTYQDETEDIFCIPAWLSIIPSLLTVMLAIILQQSLLALLAGTFLGATIIYGGNPLLGLLRTLDTILIRGMVVPEHACILLFCLFIGGMIGVLGVGGGAQGLAQVVTKFAKTRKRAALATFFLGVLTFFDDYASCLITGMTMKDITGMMKISREKLSFIVDTCAANTAAISLVSSWIGVEISYIIREFNSLGLEADGFGTFLRTLPFAFYPWLVLSFCMIGILLGRDFGPMLHAERRALTTGLLVREDGVPLTGSEVEGAFLKSKEGRPQYWWNAAIPFAVIVIVVVGAMIGDGSHALNKYSSFLARSAGEARRNKIADLASFYDDELDSLSKKWSLSTIVSSSVPFHGLLWASVIASAVAIVLAVCQRTLSLSEAMDAWMCGAKSMLFALLILIMAWGLGDVCRVLQAADWISSGLNTQLAPGLLPTLVFIAASGVSFATGSAWGTMSILFPLMIRLAYTLDPANDVCLLATIAAILSGAVWGNQSSPIADSCIMSSVSTGSDHTDHVKTQGVYTAVVGLTSILTCSLPVGFGIYPWYVGYIFGISLLTSLFFLVGAKPDDDASIPAIFMIRPFLEKSFSGKFKLEKTPVSFEATLV